MDPLHAHVRAKESVEDDILKQPGVTGIGVGHKWTGGKRTDQIAVQVFVKEKKTVPKPQAIPPEINGVPTDVIERTFVLHPALKKVLDLEPMADTSTYNPLKGGVSIGPCRAVGGFVFAGTLGMPVRDRATGNPLLLSNFHVMCVDNGWSVGDQMTQPSRVDSGSCPSGVVGTLLRAALTSSVDGAVCTLSGRGSACEIVDIGSIVGTGAATLNMPVRKRGRTTGLTFGNVDSVSLTVRLDYGDGIGVRTLTNQIGLLPDTAHNPKFGDHGDSGSVVVDSNRKVVGLYFAGSSDGSGVANPIAEVLNALNIDICLSKSLVKEVKDRKIEIKEIKDKREKEIKELKLEKIEIKEKIEIFEGGRKRLHENDPKGIVENPRGPIGPIGPIERTGATALEERVRQLEAGFGMLSSFIGPELRPDLDSGALSSEPDVIQKSQQLEKEAADAMHAKIAFDNKPSGQ